MLDTLSRYSHSAAYWLLLLVGCITMEAVALYYQYGLDYGPCILCIHIRIWVLALLLISLFGLFSRNSPSLQKAAHIGTLIVACGLLERSYQTLGIEQGWLDGSCGFDSGLPAWFALDKWFPVVFEPWESCGYTPELLFGITMAEALITFSAVLLLVTLIFSAVQFKHNTESK